MEGHHTDIYEDLRSGKTAKFDHKLVQLLTCSARCFAEQGYEKASMRQVAQAAGFSLANLYHYVRSKEELLFFIQYYTFGVLIKGLEAALEGEDSPEGQLRKMVSVHVSYLVEHLPELKICATELDSLGGDLYQHVLVRRHRYFDLTHEILKRLHSQDGASRVDSNLGALYLFGMLNWIVMWFDSSRNDPEELSRSLSAFFLAGYRTHIDKKEER